MPNPPESHRTESPFSPFPSTCAPNSSHQQSSAFDWYEESEANVRFNVY